MSATIKIDDREIPFENGDTVMRAAHRAGIDIPHYCWHPGLSIAANCRMCLIEVLPPPGRPAMELEILRWDEIKGEYVSAKKPKLQPACQMTCAPGMHVLSDTSKHVEEARAAVQEPLLLNHPVDCPICDQAGECRLQDYWLEHQRKAKRMREEVVHKPKAQVFGPTIVYDAERCILCTRCVRVCSEVAQDPVLSVRERGNLGEIVVSPGRSLDHNYTLMTEHVCPVGALTSTDFRFKARVWFLRSARTVCQGCATGCNAFLDFDPRTNTAHRYRPRENMQINKYWMCDEGMLSYKRVKDNRIENFLVGGQESNLEAALVAAKQQLQGHELDASRIAIVLSAQHSSEDNFALVTFAKTYIGSGEFYLSGKPLGKGDSILMSDDKNPNTMGVMQLTSTTPPKPMSTLIEAIRAGKYQYVIALGSDIEVSEDEASSAFKKLQGLICITSHNGPLSKAAHVVFPSATWAESDGTYVNRNGFAQQSEHALTPASDVIPAWLSVVKLAKSLGYTLAWKSLREVRTAMNKEAYSLLEPQEPALQATV